MSWKRRVFSLSPFLFFPFFFPFLPFLPPLCICIWGIKNGHVLRDCLPQPAAPIYFMPHFKKKRHQRELGAGRSLKPLSENPGSAPGWFFFSGDSLQFWQTQPVAGRSLQSEGCWQGSGSPAPGRERLEEGGGTGQPLRVPADIFPADLPPLS